MTSLSSSSSFAEQKWLKLRVGSEGGGGLDVGARGWNVGTGSGCVEFSAKSPA